MIRSYRDRDTQRFAAGETVRRFEPVRRQAEKRLRLLEAAQDLTDLRQLPGNRLEALKGDRRGQYSIRINDRWRVCFEWPGGADGPENVEIVDYHQEVRAWRAPPFIPARSWPTSSTGWV